MVATQLSRLISDASVLCLLALIVPIFAAITPVLIWIPAVVAALAIGIQRGLDRGPWPLNQRSLMVCVFSLTVWGTLSSLWAIDPVGSLGTAGRLLLISICMVLLIDAGSRLSVSERERFRIWLIAGVVSGVLIALVVTGTIIADTVWVKEEEMAYLKLASLNRTASIIAILVWPAAISIAHTYNARWATGFVLIATLTIFLQGPLAPLLALGIGAITFTVAWFAFSLARAALLLAFAVCIVIVPFLDTLGPWANELLLTNLTVNASEVHRLVIWQFVADHIFERPILGWGLDAARVFPGANTELYLVEGQPYVRPEDLGFYTEHVVAGDALAVGPALPLHPHNAVIQIWLELGFVGVLLMAGLLFLAVRSVPRALHNRRIPSAAIATIATSLTIAQLSFGVWQGWWLATLGMAAVVMVAIAGCQVTHNTLRRH